MWLTHKVVTWAWTKSKHVPNSHCIGRRCLSICLSTDCVCGWLSNLSVCLMCAPVGLSVADVRVSMCTRLVVLRRLSLPFSSLRVMRRHADQYVRMDKRPTPSQDGEAADKRKRWGEQASTKPNTKQNGREGAQSKKERHDQKGALR